MVGRKQFCVGAAADLVMKWLAAELGKVAAMSIMRRQRVQVYHYYTYYDSINVLVYLELVMIILRVKEIFDKRKRRNTSSWMNGCVG